MHECSFSTNRCNVLSFYKLMKMNLLLFAPNPSTENISSSKAELALTPRNMLREESKPAAYIFATRGFNRSQRMRHANRDIVLCSTLLSPVLSPGIVSITTKSMGDSEDRPICKNEHREIMSSIHALKHRFPCLNI
jgi:hypothetical protein